MCRTCKSRSNQAACSDEQDQPKAASNIQQEKYPDIKGYKRINIRIKMDKKADSNGYKIGCDRMFKLMDKKG
jgi:hypothetical protein